MAEPEMEDFEITADDLENEFNPFRNSRKQTREDNIYGMWAEHDSDDDGPKYKRGGKKAKDYTAPVNFVSGGIKVGDKVTKAEAGDDGGSSDSDKDDTELVLKKAAQQKGRKFQGSAFRKATTTEHKASGEWEKYTKGIGGKLMESMGYVPGKGIGKNLQGISTPVEAVVRKGKGAVGFYGSEKKNPPKEFGNNAVANASKDSAAEADENAQPAAKQWKKADSGRKQPKLRYVYKTLDEIIATGVAKPAVPETQRQLASVKVIDMTGKEQRVLSGYQSLSNKHDKPDEKPVSVETEKKEFDVPELQHNLDLLVRMAEEDIVQNNRQLRYEKDVVVNLKHETDKLRTLCEREEEQVTRLKEVLGIVHLCQDRAKPNSAQPLSLHEVTEVLDILCHSYYEEYKFYRLSELAVALVSPMLKREFAQWNPLVSPEHGLEAVKKWKAVLEDSEGNYSVVEGQLAPYERIMWEIWMPPIRSAILGQWQPRESDEMIELLTSWLPLLPVWIWNNILDQLLVPRLQREVDAWNPLTDTVPIHAWLHPWLPLLGDRLEPLYAPIRHKLASALTGWHPSDPSAKLMLQPWATVFKPGVMDAFLVKNIVPKLALALQEYVINPLQQDLAAWNWVMTWSDLVPHPCMVSLLEKNFFPRWLQVLGAWLVNNPNYTEVTNWYTGWKALLPDRYLAEPAIKEQLNRALEFMNRAVSGNLTPGARENIAYLTHTERRYGFETPAPPPAAPATSRPATDKREVEVGVRNLSTPETFKDLVEKRAEENGLLFMPVPNKLYEAKQVYKFGRAFIYIDRGVVFVNEQQHWVPISLSALVDRAS